MTTSLDWEPVTDPPSYLSYLPDIGIFQWGIYIVTSTNPWIVGNIDNVGF